MTKILVMDVDGTLTDGKIYMGPQGEAMKAFSVKDGYGINDILRPNKIEPVIITGRDSKIVANRCAELNIFNLHQGISNKKKKLVEVVLSKGISLGEVAYIGDDANDLECINMVNAAGGMTACPQDAVKSVRESVKFVCKAAGGDGAVREFVEFLCAMMTSTTNTVLTKASNNMVEKDYCPTTTSRDAAEIVNTIRSEIGDATIEKNDNAAESVLSRFLRYVSFDTQSDDESGLSPSTKKQKDLAKLLYNELIMLGLSDVYYDEEDCYVYAKIPGNDSDITGTLGFIAHLDTSPEMSGAGVNPRLIADYDGSDIVLNEELSLVLSPKRFPELKNYIGKSLVVTDGTTLLGADDKAGVAEIMAMAEKLVRNPEIKHGDISIAFTRDEEIGTGVDKFDLDRFGADYAYTVDGGALGELEYENFNAASAKITVHGVTVHPGEAKGKMKNASLIAMEFNELLPHFSRPENTEGYEGFIHLTDMRGSVETAVLSYIVRDHDLSSFDMKKQLIDNAAGFINQKYGEDTVEVEIVNSYFNMRDIIYPDNMFLIDNAVEAMKELGITPSIKPIRGGTDGARLSFMGIPCPNLCAGGHNFHGRYEYVCVESMEKIVELLIGCAQKMK